MALTLPPYSRIQTSRQKKCKKSTIQVRNCRKAPALSPYNLKFSPNSRKTTENSPSENPYLTGFTNSIYTKFTTQRPEKIAEKRGAWPDFPAEDFWFVNSGPNAE